MTSVDVVLADTIRVGLCAPEDEVVIEEDQLELDDVEDECVVLETILLVNPDELNIDVPNPEEEEFEPPADFHEFRDRWPDHIKTYLYRKRCPPPLVEEFAQDIALHFMTVSARSPFRDRIDCYQPERVNVPRNSKKYFFYYVNMVINRRFQMLVHRRRRDPVTNRGAISIAGEMPNDGEPTGGVLTDEALCWNVAESRHYRSGFDRNREHTLIRQEFVRGFMSYVYKINPDLAAVAKMIGTYSSLPDICRHRGIPMIELNKAKNHLRLLAQNYNSRIPDNDPQSRLSNITGKRRFVLPELLHG